MLGRMMQNAGEPAVNLCSNPLDIFRFYSAVETAERFDATLEALSEWVREGFIQPVFLEGESRYSGLVIVKLLGWPVSDDPRVYLAEQILE